MTAALAQLRRRIAIERPENVTDGSGGFSRGYALLAETFATIEPLSAQETMRGYALGLTKLVRVTIRARGDVSGGCRVVWRATTYDVLSVRALDADGRFEELLCQEVAP